MSLSRHTIRITVAGGTQFVATTAITTFNEFENLNALPDNYTAKIHHLSYNSLGAAHTFTANLSPAVGSAANLQIILRAVDATTTPATANSFTLACGDGIVVPRQTGLINNATQAPTDPFPSPDTSYVLLFSTTGKAGDGTLTVVYSIEEQD